MTAIEHLETWYTEICTELAEARAALPPLETELSTAETAARLSVAAHLELQGALGQIRRPAAPLVARMAWTQSERDAASGRVSRARGVLEQARARITELEQALAQLDELIAPEAAEAA